MVLRVTMRLVREERPQDDAAHEMGQERRGKNGEDLGRGVQLDEPVGDGLAHGLQGRDLVRRDAVAAHVQADQNTGDADGWDEQGAEQGAFSGGAVALG